MLTSIINLFYVKHYLYIDVLLKKGLWNKKVVQICWSFNLFGQQKFATKSFGFFFFIVYVGLLNYDKSNNHNYFGKTLIVQHDCSVILHKSNLFIPIML